MRPSECAIVPNNIERSCYNQNMVQDKEKFVLAVMSSSDGNGFSAVQVQKIFFLVDQEISDLVGGRQFSFAPHHYGPFDKNVYSVLESLVEKGLVYINFHSANRRNYMLTPQGHEIGQAEFADLPPNAQDFIRQSSEFVRENTFADLVAAIYKSYPEMRENSVFYRP